MIKAIPELLKTPRFRQVSSLYFSIIINFVLGFICNVVVVNALGSSLYGDYKLLQNTWQLAFMVLGLGVFPALSLQIAENNDANKRRRIYGVAYTVTLGLFLIIGSALLIVSYIYKFNSTIDLNHLLRLTLPIVIGPFFQLLFENIFTGDNQIKYLSILRVFPQAAFLLVFFLFKYYNISGLTFVIVAQQVPYIMLLIYYAKRIRLDFSGFKEIFAELYKTIIRHGFHIYVGALIGVGSMNVISILISEYLSTKELGYFSLGFTVASPLLFLPSVIATTFMKDFVNLKQISNKLINYSILINGCSFIAFFILLKPMMALFYKPEFAVVIPYASFLAIATLVQGFGDIFNRFLCAKGLGKKVRNVAITLGIFGIIVFLGLVKFTGLWGAVIARIVYSSIYMGGMLYYYRSYLKSKAAEDE